MASPFPAATAHDLAAMHAALEQAHRAGALGEVPVGAVVYDPASGIIVARAHNQRESHANPAGHAELLAITAAARSIGDFRLSDYALAVTLEPCPMCAGAIVNARLPRVVFGAKDPKAGFAGSLGNLLQDPRLNHRVATVIPGVLEAEAAGVLKEFFRARRGG